MNYTTEHAIERILSGQKTQTRRIMAPGDTIVNGDWMSAKFITKKKVGGIYRVCPGRGKSAVQYCNPGELLDRPLRHRFIAIVEEDARNISLHDARAEGFQDQIEFWKVWVELHEPEMCFSTTKPGRFIDSTRKTVPEVQRMLFTYGDPTKYRCAAITFEVVP